MGGRKVKKQYSSLELEIFRLGVYDLTNNEKSDDGSFDAGND